MGRGAPLFVLHGGPGGSHSYFLPYLNTLAGDYRLVLYDQRGTGLSDGHLDLQAITIDQFAEDLDELRSALGFEKIALMGHSWGGLVALAYAIKYPARLDHLILVDPVPLSSAFGVEFASTLKQRAGRLTADERRLLGTTCARTGTAQSAADVAACNRIDAELRFYDPAKAAAVDWPAEKNTVANAATVRALLTASFNKRQPDLEAGLPGLSVPTLIVRGDYDPIPQASADYLQQHIQGSQLAVIPHSGHFPFIEQPDQFAAVVRSFLSN